ncbi:MAG: hypothetical protein IPK19_09710 [Chloroflexi bacterium]|nr:hypothetical protein [Chloroflexota bacterium]
MITQDDLELLNAYLDDALSPEERAVVDARLVAEPALRQELESLRATAELLRRLPTLRSPRDLTLTQQMVRTSRTLPFPAVTVSLISAAASIALIVVGLVMLQSSGQFATGSPVSDQASEASLTDALSVAGLPTSTVLPSATVLPTLALEASLALQNTVAAGAEARGAETASPPTTAIAQPTQPPVAKTSLPAAALLLTATPLPGLAESEMRDTNSPPVAGMLLESTVTALANAMDFAAEAPAAMDSATFMAVPSARPDVGGPPGEAGAAAEELGDAATRDDGVGAAAPQIAQATLLPTSPPLAQVTRSAPTATPPATRTLVATPPVEPSATPAAPVELEADRDEADVAPSPDGRLFIGLGVLLGFVAVFFAVWARRQ